MKIQVGVNIAWEKTHYRIIVRYNVLPCNIAEELFADNYEEAIKLLNILEATYDIYVLHFQDKAMREDKLCQIFEHEKNYNRYIFRVVGKIIVEMYGWDSKKRLEMHT